MKIKYEITKVAIARNDPKELDMLNTLANDGWRPYHTEGAQHYFFREIEQEQTQKQEVEAMRAKLGSTIEQLSLVEVSPLAKAEPAPIATPTAPVKKNGKKKL